MTILQKEIKTNENMIQTIGWYMVNGFAENNEELAPILAVLIKDTDEKRDMQEDAFNKMPWLRKVASRE